MHFTVYSYQDEELCKTAAVKIGARLDGFLEERAPAFITRAELVEIIQLVGTATGVDWAEAGVGDDLDYWRVE